MIPIKTTEEIEIMRLGGRILAGILDKIAQKVKPSVSAADLDKLARELVFSSGGRPSFLNYAPGGKGDGYPAALCVSINEEIVHGLPEKKKIFSEGDLVKLDMGVEYKGLHTDATIMVGVGKISPIAKKLLETTKVCLDLGIKKIKPGVSLNEYARAVQEQAEKSGFSVVRDLVGHGIGRDVHEPPQILNYADPRMEKIILKEGMALALEPMVNEGGFEITLDDDGWTYRTGDRKLNAHWEHTVAVTKKGCEILTKK